MPQRYEVGIFKNEHARKEALQNVVGIIGKKLHGNTIPFSEEIAELPDRLIVVGGERSVRTMVQEMSDRKQWRPVALAGGGAHDVTFNELRKVGRTMTVEEFVETPVDEFPEELLYHPGEGVMVGEEYGEIFNNHIGLGKYEEASGDMNEVLRFLPPLLRSLAARSLAAPIAVIRSGERVDIYSVSSHIGYVNAFPEQELQGSDITHAWIDGNDLEQAAKLAITLVLWQAKMRPPETVLHTERRYIYNATTNAENVWIDGDTLPNPLHGEVTIKRSDSAFPIVALVQ